MATPKLNPSRSIAVIPSDYCNIPNPALFITDGKISITDSYYFILDVPNPSKIKTVKAGDIIYNYDSQYASTVISVEDLGGNQYQVNHNSPSTFDNEVFFYNGEDDSTGCVLYVGQGGNLSVTTEGGDDVVLVNVPTGSFLPIQVLKVKASQAQAILALR